MPECLRRHIDNGRMAVVREPGTEGGCLVLYRGERRQVIMQASDIPATLHGAATFNIANALAACAIACAHDVPILTIRSALAGASPYLRQFGIVLGGWLMARAAVSALASPPEFDTAFLSEKVTTARFYGEQLLPTANGLIPSVKGGIELLDRVVF